MENTVIVVGAGAAGLMAAYTLSKHNKKVILLEALNRPGGRIHTHTGNGFSSHIEAGAEFIHGDLKLTKKLLNEAGINYTPVKGEMFSVQNGKFFKQEQTHWDEVMEKMEALDTDVTLLDFLTDNFKGEEYASLRKSVTGFAEGFDLADVSKASTKSLYKEWSHEDEMQYRVDGGYNQLIYFLEAESKKNGCIIYNNCCVKKINWCKNEVSVLTMCSRFFKAEKIIIAVPLSVLQSSKNETGYIDFAPAVNAYTEAANNIGFGSVIKIIIEFDEAFWNSYKRNTGFFLIEEIIPTWWTQMPDNKPVLTGWLSGEKAGALQHKSNEEIFEASIQSLASAFALNIETVRKKVVAHYVANWQNMPGIFCAYSYNTLNSVTAKQILNNAVEETVYFAGEALYDGKALGTVEAALISGERTALKMMYDN